MGRASSQDGGEARRTQDGRLAAARTYRARLDTAPQAHNNRWGGGGAPKGCPPPPPRRGRPGFRCRSHVGAHHPTSLPGLLSPPGLRPGPNRGGRSWPKKFPRCGHM